MLYGGKPLKPAPPAKKCTNENMIIHGPGAYSYGLVAKQPGSDYKIRIRDMERVRLSRYNLQPEESYKSISRNAQHIQMIDVTDKKCFYNQIKKMVDDEMKANEHLFTEECPKQELVEDKEIEPEIPKMSVEELQEIMDEWKKKKDEEERKIVEEKRLQHFIVNSDELRGAAIAKRKKEIADLNYKIIQEKENMAKEQKIKNREIANLNNTQFIKSQIHEKEEKKRKLLEQKQQFRNELRKQLQEKEIVQKQEKELKNSERNDLIKLKEKLDKEEEFEKLERIKNQKQNQEEIKLFIEERRKLFSKMNEMRSILNDKVVTAVGEHFIRNATDDCEEKLQLRRENEMFMKHDVMIKEERRKQNEEMSNILVKQIKEIEELKLSVERKNDESRRKRVEEGNRILMEQLKVRKELVEKQKAINREAYEESVRDYENYLKEEKELCEKRKQSKQIIRKDLNDQINARKDIMKKQKVNELENHRKCMRELAEQEELLQKLLKQV